MESTIFNYEKIENGDGSLKAKGEFRLRTPHSIVRTVSYIITTKVSDAGYEYTIDSVSLTEKKRGISTTTKSSKEIVEEMEDFGKQAENAERILNEIDMRLQQVLALLKKKISINNATASL
jgi:hypothetical protein